MRVTPLLTGVAVAAFAGAVAATVWLRQRFVLVTIKGSSMQPTYRTGDRVLVRRTPLLAIRKGTVVVVEQPTLRLGFPADVLAWEPNAAASPTGKGLDRHWMIKRAAAVPGDPVPKELAEVLGATPGEQVPPRHLAVLGDNPNGSYDSRSFGCITGAQVLGVAVRAVGRATQRSPPAVSPFRDSRKARPE